MGAQDLVIRNPMQTGLDMISLMMTSPTRHTGLWPQLQRLPVTMPAKMWPFMLQVLKHTSSADSINRISFLMYLPTLLALGMVFNIAVVNHRIYLPITNI